MATRTPLREHELSLLDWAEETGLAPEGEPDEGVPWRLAVLILACLALLIVLEIALAFGVAKIVTGRAY